MALAQFCRDRKIFIISDEAYEDLIYEGQHFSIGSLKQKLELPGRIILRDPENLASAHVLEKVGMQKEGHFRYVGLACREYLKRTER